jgi:hypothetical protein
MYVGAFFNVSNSAINIIDYRFDLLLHFCVQSSFFLLLCID